MFDFLKKLAEFLKRLFAPKLKAMAPTIDSLQEWSKLKDEAARCKAAFDAFVCEHFLTVAKDRRLTDECNSADSFQDFKLVLERDRLFRAMCAAIDAERKLFSERIHPCLPKPKALNRRHGDESP